MFSQFLFSISKTIEEHYMTIWPHPRVTRPTLGGIGFTISVEGVMVVLQMQSVSISKNKEKWFFF